MSSIKLTRWSRPDHYAGAEWPEYFIFLSQHRDSDALTRSNFQCAIEQIGGESDTVHIVREGHWAVGWVEWIAVHESDTEAICKAEDILKKIDSYPVLNEIHFSELEWSEAENYWGQLSLRERIDLCKDAGISVFSARQSYIPRDDSGFIYESLTRC